MNTPSKRKANFASQAKRTASVLRTLASSCLDDADRGVLLTAATIADGISVKEKKAAKALKASEEKFDRAFKAAIPDAEKLLSELPRQTLRDRVALAFIDSCSGSYLKQIAASNETTAKDAFRALDYEINDSVRNKVQSIAYSAARTGKPVLSFKNEIENRFSALLNSPDVATIVRRLDFLEAREQTIHQ